MGTEGGRVSVLGRLANFYKISYFTRLVADDFQSQVLTDAVADWGGGAIGVWADFDGCFVLPGG